MTEIRTVPGGSPKWTRDAAANDSDKSWTVPVGKVRIYKYIAATITCTATVGNRQLAMNITDGTDIVFHGLITANIVATAAGGAVWAVGMADSTTIRGRLGSATTMTSVQLSNEMPEMHLPAGYVVRVWDKAAVDAAADDMEVVLHYIEYDA